MCDSWHKRIKSICLSLLTTSIVVPQATQGFMCLYQACYNWQYRVQSARVRRHASTSHLLTYCIIYFSAWGGESQCVHRTAACFLLMRSCPDRRRHAPYSDTKSTPYCCKKPHPAGQTGRQTSCMPPTSQLQARPAANPTAAFPTWGRVRGQVRGRERRVQDRRGVGA